jgi:hypothetical protein
MLWFGLWIAGLRVLAKACETARAALERTRSARPSLEIRRRIETLPTTLDDPVPEADTLRRLRAVVVLEHVGTPAARRVLRRLSEGTAEARLICAAKKALTRLSE